MRYVYIIAGSLVGLIVIIAIIGALLPRDHVASMTTTVPASPEQVWAVLTDVASFPTWRGDVKKVEVMSANPLSWREYTSNGTLTMAAESVEPPRRMIGRIQDKDQPFGGAWEYDVAPSGPNATRVTITERGWVSNPIFRFVSKYVMGHYSTMDSYLRALGRKFGAEVTPARV